MTGSQHQNPGDNPAEPVARPDEPTLDDVMEPTETAPRDREFHGKSPDRGLDEELEHRVEHERVQAGVDDYVEEDVHSATE